MFNGLLLFAASLRSKKVFYIFALSAWAVFMLINYNYSMGIGFAILNFEVVFLITYLIRKFNRGNLVLAVLSVLVYSIFIDIICFFMFPTFTFGVDLFTYVYNGIIFNYKPIILNIIAGVIFALTKTVIKGVERKKQNINA
ncbi:MAG: hypothetical protein AB7S44_02805 [Spirochaetales bacterium]